jgi:4-amino-4-deoxy-L-arabinose transferase-like glycosyltransferase
MSVRDGVLLALFCLMLFGFQMFSGRPLSLHEARLPECSREMLAGHNWLFPQSGGRPWLERPPLPQWIEVAVSVLFGQHCDRIWVVRLPAVLMGTSIVLMTAWMASLWFGRITGLLSGLVLATTYEFYAYSILAEDDIFLAAVVVLAVTLFVSLEFASGEERNQRVRLFGNRPWQVWGLFLALGVSNLAKGPLVGAAVVVATIGAFILSAVQRAPADNGHGVWSWSLDLSRARRYAWVWGGLIFSILVFAWSWAAHRRYPEISRNLFYDYQGTLDFDQPIWYYPEFLVALGVPWIFFAVIGLARTFPAALGDRRSPQRFLWCWAIVPVLVLSIPHRKHHHYLVPSLAPWGVLGAIGLGHVWTLLCRQVRSPRHALIEVLLLGLAPALGLLAFQRLGPVNLRLHASFPAVMMLGAVWLAGVTAFFHGLLRRSGAITSGACFVGVAAFYCWGQVNLPDLTTQDTLFLARVEALVPRNGALFVNSDLHGEMDFFRNQFYLRPDARLLHNLSFLRDRQITAPDVWVVTRHEDLRKLQQLGEVEVKDESLNSRREADWARASHRPAADYRFTLFLLHYRPDLQRYPRPPYIGTLQAMGREPGPYCGPPL